MGDILAASNAWLDGMRRAHVSHYVSYTRGSVTTPCLATVTQTVFETQSEMGVIERWESRDFLVSAADLPFGDPVRGDLISETLNGVAVTFEVCAPRGAPLWKWTDTTRATARIHTKVLSEADAG